MVFYEPLMNFQVESYARCMACGEEGHLCCMVVAAALVVIVIIITIPFFATTLQILFCALKQNLPTCLRDAFSHRRTAQMLKQRQAVVFLSSC